MESTSGAQMIWFFDFDGTLSQIVADRNEAALYPDCRELLRSLAARPDTVVAVISSRSLDDLIVRVPVSGVCLGGGSGIEWRLPGGERLVPPREMHDRLSNARLFHMRRLEELVSLAGAVLEDKYWSVAVHCRRISRKLSHMLGICLERWCAMNGLRLFHGPEVMEIQLLPEIDKKYGVRWLCRFVDFTPDRDRLYYAGDDENDAVAMEWVLSKGGYVFSIGDIPLVEGAHILDGPASLAWAVKRVIGL